MADFTGVLIDICTKLLLPKLIVVCLFVSGTLYPVLVLCSVCKLQGDCDGCAICYEGECDYPFTQLFDKNYIAGRPCIHVLNHCNRTPCMAGDCINSFGVPACVCPEGYYGTLCDQKAKYGAGSVTSGVYNKYPYMPTMGDVEESHVMFEVLGNNMETTVRYDGGGLIRETRWEPIRILGTYGTDGCKQPNTPTELSWQYAPDRVCKYHIYMYLRLPYLPYDREPIMTGGILQGYLTSSEITIRNKIGSEVVVAYNHVFKIFVKARDLFDSRCSCRIKLLNCGETLETPVTYYRSSHINLESDLTFEYDGLRPTKQGDFQKCKDDTKLTLKMWTIEDFVPYDEMTTIPISIYYADSYENFNSFARVLPYTLDFGVYKVTLEVKYIHMYIYNKLPFSFQSGYFEINPRDLVIQIDQGNTHTTSLEDGILLTTSRSSDPNFPRTKEFQKKVRITWLCLTVITNVTETKCKFKPQTLSVFDSYYIEPKLVERDHKYIIEAKIMSDSYSIKRGERLSLRPKTVTTSVLVVTPGDYEQWTITCMRNCGMFVIPNELLILRVTGLQTKAIEKELITWKYNKEGEKEEVIADSMVIPGYPSMYLILKENALKANTKYVIKAEGSVKHPINPFNIQTTGDEVVYTGNWSVDPPKGQKGITQFDIVCAQVQGGKAYQFEYYDKYKEEVEEGMLYSGRMLGTSYSGDLPKVILTRGIVVVYIVNEMGLSSKKEIPVDLSGSKVNFEYLSVIEQKLDEVVSMGDVQGVLRFVSFVPDIFQPLISREKMIVTLLEATFRLSISNIAEAKLATSAVKNVVVGMRDETFFNVPTHIIEKTMKRIRETTELLDRDLRDIGPFESGERTKYIEPNTVKQLTTYIVDSVHSLLMYAGNDTYEIDEDFIDFDISFQLQMSTKHAEVVLNLVKNILTYLQYSVKPVKIVSMNSAYTVWVAMNHGGLSLPELLKLNKDIPLSIPDILMRNLLNNNAANADSIYLQVTESKKNIAWWSRGHVKSNIISIDIVVHKTSGKLNKVLSLDEPIAVLFNVSKIQQINFTNTVSQLDSNVDPFKLDLNVKVFRLHLPPATFTEIKFLYPPTNSSLRALILNKRYRPDYAMVILKSTVFNKTSPSISIVTSNDEDNLVYYLAVLPGPEVPVAQTSQFTFEINTIRCQLWFRGRWVGRNCQYANSSGNQTVVCSSNHLSMFSVGVPPHSDFFEPYSEIKMLLRVYNNYLVIGATLLLVLLYFILCVWAVQRDYEDRSLRIVTILSDNYPRDRHLYLVSVWTSSRFKAGTTAHVAIKLYGDENVSRVHILSRSDDGVMKRNTDNWFLILCPKPLGTLYFLQVWHDNYGSSPDWFCNKICVYDLKSKMEYIFPVGQWVALSMDEYPEIGVFPAYVEDLMKKRRTFMESLRYEMREGHLLTSIMLRHARSYVSRLERLTILLCCVMIALSWSVFCYSSVSQPGVDDWTKYIEMRDIFVALQIMAINFIYITFITYVFKSSARFPYQRCSSTLITRSQSTGELLSWRSMRLTELDLNNVKDLKPLGYEDVHGRSVFRRFTRAIYTIKRPRSKVPVQLPECEPVVEVKVFWYLVAWTVCLAIIILSVCVVLWSVSLGYNQNWKCLFCAFLGICGETFIVTPLEILILSTLFAFGLKVVLDPPPHHIKASNLKYYRKIYDNKDHYLKIINLRSDDMYKPISVFDKERRLIKRDNQWSKVIRFLVMLVFMICISYSVSNVWTSHYYSNCHTKEIFNLGHSKIGTVDFTDLKNTVGTESYLHGTLMRAIYLLRWYNGQLMASENENLDITIYRTSDYTSKMVGKPLVRQLRVSPISCRHPMVQNESKCIPPYSFDNEDKSVYGMGWTPGQWSDREKGYSPWQYNDRSLSWLLRQYNCYGSSNRELNYGGYMVYLSPYRFESMMIITELIEQSWLDNMTRAVIIDVTVYNVNKDLFSHITMFVEAYHTSQYFLKIQVSTVPGGTSFGMSDLVYIILLVYITMLAIKGINREGLIQYVTTKKNLLQTLIVVLGNSIVLFQFLHLFYAGTYLSNAGAISQTEPIDFEKFVYYFKITGILLCVLLATVIIHVLCFMDAGRCITCCYFTFLLNLKNIAILMSIFVMFMIVQWRFAAFLLNMTGCHNFGEAFVQRFQRYQTSHFRDTTVLFIVTQLAIKITMFLFISLFLNGIKVARKVVGETYNFVTFLFSELKELVHCKRE